MWESFTRLGLFTSVVNWVGALIVYLIDGRISSVLIPIAIIWTLFTIFSYIKVKKEK